MNRFLLFPVVLMLALSCGWREHPAPEEVPVKDQKEAMLGANRELIERDAELIAGFIKRRNWQMEKAPAGFFYHVYEHGQGEQVRKGDFVSLEYSLWLLDGTLCYSSEQLGPLEFRVGQGGVETGLEEAVLLFREGDRARLILPPFLAHGLVGDQNKIPPRSSIVYDLKVANLKR